MRNFLIEPSEEIEIFSEEIEILVVKEDHMVLLRVKGLIGICID